MYILIKLEIIKGLRKDLIDLKYDSNNIVSHIIEEGQKPTRKRPKSFCLNQRYKGSVK